MHHSSERLDIVSAFWFSPLDMVTWTLLPSLVLTLLGVPPQAATITLLSITFLAMFQHANVRTPAWLGYFVQRPEMHTVHHARGVHHYNYADLPVFDMLFGTFRNPHGYEHETGFWHGASARVADMLLLRDVSAPVARSAVIAETTSIQSRRPDAGFIAQGRRATPIPEGEPPDATDLQDH